jgi:hypothetical protein
MLSIGGKRAGSPGGPTPGHQAAMGMDGHRGHQEFAHFRLCCCRIHQKLFS